MILARPKNRGDAQLVHLVDQDHEVMAQHLGQRLVDLGGLALAPERVAKLPLDHAERGLDVRSLVVVGQELVAAVHEIAEHLFPGPEPAAPGGVRLERDERLTADPRDSVGVANAAVRLVGGYLTDGEILGGGVHERGQLLGVGRVLVVNLDGRRHVRLDAAHDVRLHPRMLTADAAVLVIEPGFKAASGEARGVDGEINLNSRKRAAALCDQRTEDRGQLWIFERVQHRIVARELGNEPALLGLAEIAHAAPRGCRRVDLHHGGEDRVAQRQPRTTTLPLLLGLGQPMAQIAEQFHEAVFLVDLGFVVGGPVLRVGPLDGLGDADRLGDGAVAVIKLALDHYADGVDVLARLAPQFEVGAGAARRPARNGSRNAGDGIFARARLRGHRPSQTTPNDLRSRCDFETPLLSGIHDNPPYLYLLLVYPDRVDLSIPLVYTVCRWSGARAGSQSWGWSSCS